MKHVYHPAQAPLRPGSVALCGHIKTTPWSGDRYLGDTAPDRCPDCVKETNT